MRECLPPTMCHMSHVTCHVFSVMYHVKKGNKNYMYKFKFFNSKILSYTVKGLLWKRRTLSSFLWWTIMKRTKIVWPYFLLLSPHYLQAGLLSKLWLHIMPWDFSNYFFLRGCSSITYSLFGFFVTPPLPIQSIVIFWTDPPLSQIFTILIIWLRKAFVDGDFKRTL